MKENKTTMNAQARTAYEPVSVRVVKVTPQGVLCASGPLEEEYQAGLQMYNQF